MSKEFFENNPQVELLYETSDGYLFEKAVDAKQHAKSLEDSSIKEIRPEKEAKKTKKKEESQPNNTTA